jgi:hypothetical protein
MKMEKAKRSRCLDEPRRSQIAIEAKIKAQAELGPRDVRSCKSLKYNVKGPVKPGGRERGAREPLGSLVAKFF